MKPPQHMQGQQSATAVAVTWYERGQSDIDAFSFGWPGLLKSKLLRIIIPCGKFRSLYPGKTQQLQEQCHPLSVLVCAVFLCPNSGMAASV